jgi:peroxiredoxin
VAGAGRCPVRDGEKKIPNVVFKDRVRDNTPQTENPFKWKDVTSDDLFAGKRVVVFALHGAFTPTCPSTHLPGYERDYEAIKATGVDEIYCLSVCTRASPRRRPMPPTP